MIFVQKPTEYEPLNNPTITIKDIKDLLKEDNIDHPDFTKEVLKEPHLKAKARTFTDAEIKNLPKQSADLTDDKKMISSDFDKPIPIPLTADVSKEEIVNFVNENEFKMDSTLEKYFIDSDKYQFGSFNEKKDNEGYEASFYQLVDGKPIYDNNAGKIVFSLNNQLEVTSYEQTMLTFETFKEEKELLSDIEIIKILYSELSKNSSLEWELGYFSNTNDSDNLEVELESHVLTPTWYVKVKQENSTVNYYYVNAIEGQMFSMQE
ncbi:two-component system regulatory protein YycI [Bacillus spongiae]|uniref:Two-component system regulatory protein YycI n=1 Tax=Bacillus spongiae TaxID=2683610 RepID=A0ABU8HGP1_9BACI